MDRDNAVRRTDHPPACRPSRIRQIDPDILADLDHRAILHRDFGPRGYRLRSWPVAWDTQRRGRAVAGDPFAPPAAAGVIFDGDNFTDR